MRIRTLARARYSADLLRRVADGWRRLSDNERQGIISAARLAADLTALEAPPALLAMAARVVQDEVRHVEVCARVLEEMGAPAAAAPIELALGLPALGAPSRVAAEGRVARTLIGELALGRPLVAASFASARATVREPLLAWAYAELLHDKSRHATFGAKAAAWVIRQWSPEERQALWTGCLALAGGGGGRYPLVRDPEAESLGLLPGEVECALPRWILPHLEPLGVLQRPSNDLALVH
jgi:hypothetical protein